MEALEVGPLSDILNIGIDALFDYAGEAGGGSLAVDTAGVNAWATSHGQDFNDSLDDIT